MSARKCQGVCGGNPIPPNKGPGHKRKWCSEKCRKKTLYGEPCKTCGKPISYGNSNKSNLCITCLGKHKRATTRQWIIEAMQAWNRKHGQPPTATEWNKSGYDRPCTASVQNNFGSWNAGIKAAGLKPVAAGHARNKQRIAA